MKVKYPEGSKCFLAILNTSDSALPASVLNATATVSDDDDDDIDDHDDDDDHRHHYNEYSAPKRRFEIRKYHLLSLSVL